METIGSVFSLLGMLLLLVAIFAGAYFLTRFVGKQYGAQGGGERKMRLLEQATLGKNNQLVLVRVLDKVYLLALGTNGATKIDTLDGALFSEQEQPSLQGQTFLNVLGDAVRRQKNGAQTQKNQSTAERTDNTGGGET